MEKMSSSGTSIRAASAILAVLVTLVLAGVLRLDGLGEHPMHADEAVQATKFQTFLEDGWFDYDPEEYHGPLPHYLLRAGLSLGGWIDERREREKFNLNAGLLRLVPAVTGVVVVALVGWMAFSVWGPVGLFPALLLASVSTSLVYYSRYFIAETFLLASTCLFVSALARFLAAEQPQDKDRRQVAGGKNVIFWGLLAGVGAGLMHASKETCILSFAAAAVAGFAVYGAGRSQRRFLWVGVASGVFTSVAFYSDGFRHWPDVSESLTTYFRYLGRAGGGEGHNQPWWFYLQRYGWFRGGYVWSEVGVIALGCSGFIAAWRRGNRSGKFFGLYGVILFCFYSVIPYKTPWSVLPAFIVCFPLAGGIFTLHRKRAGRLAWLVILLIVSGHLVVQARRATHRMPTDPRNPYAYAHTSPAIFSLVDLVAEIDALRGADTPLKLVIVDPGMGWPLPWYFRDRKEIFFRESFPKHPTAPLVIVAINTLPDQGAGAAWQGYHEKLFGLRADLPLVFFIQEELWMALLEAREVAE